MLEIKANLEDKGPKIMVIGVGGGGNNAINRMITAKLKGVSFAAINTDVAVLDNSLADRKLQIGAKLLRGYGAGADPSLGEAAALENEEDLRNLVADQNMVIITCGMGGGTGTGAAPFIAKCCRDIGILTLGVVTTPFSFENKPRMKAAEAGVAKLREHVDTLLIIPNDKLLTISEKPLMLNDAFDLADSVLKDTIRGISNIVYNCGNINIDYNDVKTSLENKGTGHFGIGTTDYEGSVLEAVKQAVNCPLLDTNIAGAENILINTSGQVSLTSLNDALNYVRELAGEDVNIIWGTVSEEDVDADKIVVSIFATGMPETPKKELNKYNLGSKSITAGTKSVPQPQLDLSQIRFDETGINGFKKIPELKVQPQKQIEVPGFLSNFSSKNSSAR